MAGIYEVAATATGLEDQLKSKHPSLPHRRELMDVRQGLEAGDDMEAASDVFSSGVGGLWAVLVPGSS